MDIEVKRQKRIDSLRQRVDETLLKRWLTEDPELGIVIVKEGILTQEQVNALLCLTPEEHKEHFDAGRYSIEDIRDISSKGEISNSIASEWIKTLIEKGIGSGKFSVEDINDFKSRGEIDKHTAYSAVKALILDGIKSDMYSDNEVADFVDKDGIIQKNDLNGIWSDEKINHFWRPTITPPTPPPGLPDIDSKHTIVFQFGIPTAGKTTFMGGLLYYAGTTLGAYEPTLGINSEYGNVYLDYLRHSIRQGLLFERTNDELVVYFECVFKDKHRKTGIEQRHPLSFLEMSGETFNAIYDDFQNKDKNQKAQQSIIKVKEYIKSKNRKIINLLIDYNHEVNERGMVNQSARLRTALQKFENEGAMHSVDAINIILTKWDKSGIKIGTPEEKTHAREFLEKYGYVELISACEQYRNKYASTHNIDINVLTYSLGDFDRPNRYTYRKDYSERIHRYICNQSVILKEKGAQAAGTDSGGFIKRLFRKK